MPEKAAAMRFSIQISQDALKLTYVNLTATSQFKFSHQVPNFSKIICTFPIECYLKRQEAEANLFPLK